jgi:uncharacterized membrane protein
VKRATAISVLLVALAATLTVGGAIKQPCAGGDWSDGRQLSRFCVTDIVGVYGFERLDGPRLPYLDACDQSQQVCDEYPPLTMYTMRIAAWMTPGSVSGFYLVNVLFLVLCAVAIALMLFALAGWRALFFVLAPTLVLYAFINWDLIAVALATAGVFAYLRRRDGWAGIFLGLGAAAKLYPLLLIVPLVAGRRAAGERDGARRLVLAAAGSWFVVNLPFAILAPSGWSVFFRFNRARPPDWDSLWFMACNLRTGGYSCPTSLAHIANAGSALIFVAAAVGVWTLKRRFEPEFPRWTFGFPLLILFLLSNKVYSPQYSLWLLPWFALVMPDLRLWAAFELADIAVFVTRFRFLATLYGMPGGMSYRTFEVAVVIRTLVLIACLVMWVRRKQTGLMAEGTVTAALPGA